MKTSLDPDERRLPGVMDQERMRQEPESPGAEVRHRSFSTLVQNSDMADSPQMRYAGVKMTIGAATTLSWKNHLIHGATQ